MIEISCVMFEYPISANRYWKIARNRIYVSAEAKAYKELAGWHAKKAGIRVLQGEVKVAIKLHPKLTKKGVSSETRIDLDNAVKVALDAMNGVAWGDDSQIVSICAEIGIGVPGGGLTFSVAPA